MTGSTRTLTDNDLCPFGPNRSGNSGGLPLTRRNVVVIMCWGQELRCEPLKRLSVADTHGLRPVDLMLSTIPSVATAVCGRTSWTLDWFPGVSRRQLELQRLSVAE